MKMVRTSKKTWEHVVEDTGKQTQALSFYDQIEVRLDFRAHELSTHIYWESILDILVEWFMYMYMYIWIFVAFSKAMKDYINDMYDDHVKASKRAWLLDCTIAWCVAVRWKKFVSILSSWDFSFRRNECFRILISDRLQSLGSKPKWYEKVIVVDCSSKLSNPSWFSLEHSQRWSCPTFNLSLDMAVQKSFCEGGWCRCVPRTTKNSGSYGPEFRGCRFATNRVQTSVGIEQNMIWGCRFATNRVQTSVGIEQNMIWGCRFATNRVQTSVGIEQNMIWGCRFATNRVQTSVGIEQNMIWGCRFATNRVQTSVGIEQNMIWGCRFATNRVQTSVGIEQNMIWGCRFATNRVQTSVGIEQNMIWGCRFATNRVQTSVGIWTKHDMRL